MKTEDLIDAEKWLGLHEYATTIVDGSSLYIDLYDFEFELSSSEIYYRAELYRELKSGEQL